MAQCCRDHGNTNKLFCSCFFSRQHIAESVANGMYIERIAKEQSYSSQVLTNVAVEVLVKNLRIVARRGSSKLSVLVINVR